MDRAEPAGGCAPGRTDSNWQWTSSLPSRRRRAPPGARIKGRSGVAARSARCRDLRGPVSAAAYDPRRRHDQARLGPPLLFIQSGKFESGQVFFPKEAPWLADLEAELFAFPSGRHDDQVDSISQALGHKSPAFWTSESLEGYSKVMNALYRDAIFGRLAGRPW